MVIHVNFITYCTDGIITPLIAIACGADDAVRDGAVVVVVVVAMYS